MIVQLCEYTKNHWIDGNVSYILTKQSCMRNKRWIQNLNVNAKTIQLL